MEAVHPPCACSTWSSLTSDSFVHNHALRLSRPPSPIVDMALFALLGSYQTPILLLASIFGPSLLSLLTRRSRSSQAQPFRPPIPSTRKVFLFVHTAYHFLALFFPPYDIFVTHSLPVLTSITSLRSAVLGRTHHSSLHPSKPSEPHPLLELLLTRLQNLDTRHLYVRFGHRPLLTCVWCKDINDFVLISLPGIIRPYGLEGVIIGILGWSWVGGEEAGRRAEAWRGSFGWALGWLTVIEIGVRYLWDIRAVDGDCLHVSRLVPLLIVRLTGPKIQLSTTIHTIRSVILLLLPMVYIFLPIPSKPPSLSPLIPVLSNTHSTLRLTSLSRTAISRNARLRDAWSQAGQAETRTAQTAREDSEVIKTSEDLGLRGNEVRDNGRMWIDQGWRGMVRIQQNGSGLG